MTTRVLTGTIYHPGTNLPWANCAVHVRLLAQFVAGAEVLPRDLSTYTTDGAGQFAAELVVPDTGTAHYEISYGAHSLQAHLAAGAALDLATLVAAGAGPAVLPDALTTLLDTHNADTTAVHGIANTAALETQVGAQNKATAAQAGAQSYSDAAAAGVPHGAGLTPTLAQALAWAVGGVYNVRAFGALGDDATNDSAAIAAALAAVPDRGALYFPPGIYRAHISVRRSNLTLIFDGATLKLPAHVGAYDSYTEQCCLELGNTADPSTPYSNINIYGLVCDGNRANTPAPPESGSAPADFYGWGLALTNVSQCYIQAAIYNCWTGGMLCCIHSDYNVVNVYVENCGHATGLGADSSANYAGVDVQSAHFNTIRCVAKACQVGVRLVDNCRGNTVSGVAEGCIAFGFMASAALGNANHNNNIEMTVSGGCSESGVGLGNQTFSNGCRFMVYNVTGWGMIANGPGCTGNQVALTTSQCGLGALWVWANADNNDFVVNSNLDGRAGNPGDVYAIDVAGSYNHIAGQIVDDLPWHVRGLVIRAGAIGNTIGPNTCLNAASALDDSGTNTTRLLDSGSVQTSGLVTPSVRPAADSTTGFQIQNAAGSAALTVDTVHGFLGVGTPAPETPLHVNGSAKIGGQMTVSSPFGAGVFGLVVVGTTPGVDRDLAMFGAVGVSNGFTVQVVGGAMRYLFPDGRVGIGTGVPTAPLQVVGLPTFASNAAALAGGLTAGAFYRTGADPDPVCVVH